MTTGRARRGFTLIECMVAMVVLSIGLVGLAQMQIVASRSSSMARHRLVGTALASDLAESIALWAYTDTRLAPQSTTGAINNTTLAGVLNLPHDATLTGAAWMQFGENPNALGASTAGDPSAATSNALGTTGGAATYEGVSPDVDGDGKPDFARYWNVYAVDADSNGTTEGKFVLVTVRWHEPVLGYRSVQTTAFLPNSAVFTQ